MNTFRWQLRFAKQIQVRPSEASSQALTFLFEGLGFRSKFYGVRQPQISSYNIVYSVAHDSGSILDESIFCPRGTSPRPTNTESIMVCVWFVVCGLGFRVQGVGCGV